MSEATNKQKSADRRPRGRPSSRERMLQAASAIVVEEGAQRLTLDAVAERAGVSKGGVMYNFPTKEALLESMIDGIIARNQDMLRRTTDRLPARPGRELLAYVTNSLRSPDADDRASGALLAIIANHPKLMTRVAEFYRARFERMTRDLPFERAAIVHLATEGLWLLELMNASPLSKRERSRVAQMLRRMAEDETSP
jgi:AcrR family transcriptional regulator